MSNLLACDLYRRPRNIAPQSSLYLVQIHPRATLEDLNPRDGMDLPQGRAVEPQVSTVFWIKEKIATDSNGSTRVYPRGKSVGCPLGMRLTYPWRSLHN